MISAGVPSFLGLGLEDGHVGQKRHTKGEHMIVYTGSTMGLLESLSRSMSALLLENIGHKISLTCRNSC